MSILFVFHISVGGFSPNGGFVVKQLKQMPRAPFLGDPFRENKGSTFPDKSEKLLLGPSK